MRPAFRTALVCTSWTVLGWAAFAAEPAPLRKLEDQLAIQRAEAFAGRKLFDRAEAILRAVAESKTEASAEAQKKLDALAQERKKSDPSADAPPAYRESLAEARRGCRPLMVFFGRDTCGNCQFTKASFDKVALAPLLDRFRRVMLECDAPENAALLRRLRAGQDMKVLPFIFYVSPRDDLVDFSSGGQDVAGLKSKMLGVLKRYPPVNPQQLGKLNRTLKLANEEMLKGNCGVADRLYREVAVSPFDAPAVDEAKAGFQIIAEQAGSLLKEGQAAADKPAEAALYLVVLARKFAGTKAAAAARTELEKHKNDPEVKAVLQADASAEKTPAVASTDPPKESVDPPAKETKAQPPKAKADPARSLLDLAKNLLANGRQDRAKPLLERILKEYPDSAAATAAGDLLRNLD